MTYYVIKDGRKHSYFDNYEQARTLAESIGGDVASEVMKCVNCDYWQMGDNTCSHPLSKRLWQYTSPDNEICEHFEEEKI